MTDAKFCDIHPDQASSLIRVQSGQRSFYTIQVSYDLIEKDSNGKKNRWTVQSKNLHGCPKCVMAQILDRAKGLGVDIEWQEPFRLVRGADGKYKRLNKADKPLEEPVEA